MEDFRPAFHWWSQWHTGKYNNCPKVSFIELDGCSTDRDTVLCANLRPESYCLTPQYCTDIVDDSGDSIVYTPEASQWLSDPTILTLLMIAMTVWCTHLRPAWWLYGPTGLSWHWGWQRWQSGVHTWGRPGDCLTLQTVFGPCPAA